MGKLLVKLFTYTEAAEHGEQPSLDQLKEEVTPDLFFYALHLANALHMHLGDAYKERLRENLTRNKARYKK